MKNFNLYNVTINGDNTHIGNKYISYDSFLHKNPELDDLEDRVVKAIFDLFENDSEREKLLSSFEKIRSEENSDVDKQEKSLWIEFKDKLVDKGLDEGVEAVKDFLCKHAPIIFQMIFMA